MYMCMCMYVSYVRMCAVYGRDVAAYAFHRLSILRDRWVCMFVLCKYVCICVCVCVRMYICMCVCMLYFTPTSTYKHIQRPEKCICTYIYLHIYAHIHTCAHTQTHRHINHAPGTKAKHNWRLFKRAWKRYWNYAYICTCICIHSHTHTYIHIYIYIYTHTQTHT